MSGLLIRGGMAVTMDAHRTVAPLDVRVSGPLIAEVGPNLVANGDTVVDATGCAVLPGLVHAHLHLCQVLFRSAAEDRTLLPWLRERIWPLEAAHDPESLRASAELGIAELLLSGATCALDMGTVRDHDVVFEAARELGLRLTSGKAMMDAGDDVPAGLRESSEESLAESDRLRATWSDEAEGRLQYAYAPRFVLSCSDALLGGVAERLSSGARVHTHASENVDEIAAVQARFGRPNVEALGALGLLSERTTVAHAIHVSPSEISILADTKTSVAHCPSSNLKLGSGVARVPELLRAGVTVGLGADGAPCNNNLDLWREMKLAGLLPRIAHAPGVLSAMDVLEMATLGGARALGLADRIGSLEAGKRADVIIVDLMKPHLQPVGAEVVTALVYAAQASDVRSVYVDGRLLVSDGKLVHADADRVVRVAVEQASKVRSRAGF